MSDIAASGGYNVAGYKEGDRIGAGVVVDPAKLTAKDNVDTKMVSVDLDMNGQIDSKDDKVVVKLPPKGVIPANWEGISRLEAGGKGSVLLDEAAVPARTGAILGMAGGYLAAMPIISKIAVEDNMMAAVLVPLAGMGIGAAIGAMTADDGKGKRNALIGMGIGGALGIATSFGLAGQTKALALVGAVTAGTGLVTGGIAALNKNSEISADAQKARVSSVPDVVAPKYVLNQYLMKQMDSK
jgi:hypothetical protein